MSLLYVGHCPLYLYIEYCSVSYLWCYLSSIDSLASCSLFSLPIHNTHCIWSIWYEPLFSRTVLNCGDVQICMYGNLEDASKELLPAFWIRPATWLHSVHEIAVPIPDRVWYWLKRCSLVCSQAHWRKPLFIMDQSGTLLEYLHGEWAVYT